MIRAMMETAPSSDESAAGGASLDPEALLAFVLEVIADAMLQFARCAKPRTFASAWPAMHSSTKASKASGSREAPPAADRLSLAQSPSWPGSCHASRIPPAAIDARSHNLFRPRRARRVHARPVHPRKQSGELSRVHAHHAVNDGWPLEGAILKPLP